MMLGFLSGESIGQVPAFPGAEGFGMYAAGGRGGDVYEVTNLNDSGPGSFRAACEANGPRTVIFRISGTITAKSRINILKPNITIAGQTAPGDGICLRGAELMIRTHDVIVRYIRFRRGNQSGGDSINIMGGSSNIILDHCSISWGQDENGSFYGNNGVTVQWCMIGEGFFPHSCGGLWGSNSSYHHNLIYSNGTRNPKFSYNREGEVIDFRNNVIYNWGYQSTISTGKEGQINIVNNYFRYGPGRDPDDPLNSQITEAMDGVRIFANGNYVWGFSDVTSDNRQGMRGDFVRADQPFPTVPVTTQTAERAYELVLAQAGACLPRRDSVDLRVIEQVRSRTSTFAGTKRGRQYPGIPDSMEHLGGWPELNSLPAPADSDHDGMSDAWEAAHGLDPNDPSDRNGHTLNQDYTNLEQYINSLILIK